MNQSSQVDCTDYDLLQEKLQAASEQERHDNPVCPWCQGRGYEYADGGRLQWKCPDCEGTGGILDDEDEEEDDYKDDYDDEEDDDGDE